jgi:hypothetical protein
MLLLSFSGNQLSDAGLDIPHILFSISVSDWNAVDNWFWLRTCPFGICRMSCKATAGYRCPHCSDICAILRTESQSLKNCPLKSVNHADSLVPPSRSDHRECHWMLITPVKRTANGRGGRIVDNHTCYPFCVSHNKPVCSIGFERAICSTYERNFFQNSDTCRSSKNLFPSNTDENFYERS